MVRLDGIEENAAKLFSVTQVAKVRHLVYVVGQSGNRVSVAIMGWFVSLDKERAI